MRRQLPSVHSFSGYDVVCLLEHHAQARPQHPFIIWEPFGDDSPLSARTWSYRRFHDAALRVAAGLSARGIGRGDKVVIHMENCVEMLLAIFACGRLGAISLRHTMCASLNAKIELAAIPTLTGWPDGGDRSPSTPGSSSTTPIPIRSSQPS